MRHGRVKAGADGNLERFRSFDHSSNGRVAHKGFCGCGVETSRSVTLGPPGHPENGFECHACGELRLQFEMAKHDQSRV